MKNQQPKVKCCIFNFMGILNIELLCH